MRCRVPFGSRCCNCEDQGAQRARRTGAERGFATTKDPTTKDPATNNIARGWCRLMGLTPLMLCITTLLIVRNQRILTAWNTARKTTSAAQPQA